MSDQAEWRSRVRQHLQTRAADLRLDVAALRGELTALETELSDTDAMLEVIDGHAPDVPVQAAPAIVRPAAAPPERKRPMSTSPRLDVAAVSELLATKGPASADEIGHAFAITDRRMLRALVIWARHGNRIGRDDAGRYYSLALWDRGVAS